MENDKKIYKTEITVTLLTILIGGISSMAFPLFFIFPQLTKITIWGFPGHFWWILFIGYIGLMIGAIFHTTVSGNIEKKMKEN